MDSDLVMTAGTDRPRTLERPIRIVFFGTPEFAATVLSGFADSSHYDIALVVTQPDRPAGRGRRPAQPPVAALAAELGLPFYQPTSLRTEEARQPLRDAAADIFVVAAFGLVFGPKTLAIPPFGCVNVHASLLPRYRGASPVSAAILNGDVRTGVTLMRMDRGLDTGPVLVSADLMMDAKETTASLTARLADLGANLIVNSLPRIVSGSLLPVPQTLRDASLTRPLVKADGWLDWQRSATELERQVRAMWPWPRAWTTLDGEPLQIHAASIGDWRDRRAETGTLLADQGILLVTCGEGALALDRLQPSGGRAMDGPAFLSGRQHTLSLRLGTGPAPLTLVSPLIVPLILEADRR